MSMNLDLVIDNGQEDTVDMKTGFSTSQGVSDAVRMISSTVLEEKRVQKNTPKSSVRTNLKKTFKGSFGFKFSLNIYDDKLQKRFNKIGRDYFAEVISYFLREMVYLEPKKLSTKAEKIIGDMGELANTLIEDLQGTIVKNIHETSVNFNQEVKIRLNVRGKDPEVLGKFDRATSATLSASLDTNTIELEASITRFNIHTGNGRLLVRGDDKTVSFGFKRFRDLSNRRKKIFSKNLDQNNVIDDADDYIALNLRVECMKLPSGKVVKYLITGVRV